MENIFETKEQYVAFRNFWKQFHLDGGHKAKKVEYTSYYSKDIVGWKMESDLKGGHHLIYLAALARKMDKGFGNASKETLQGLLHTFTYGPLYYTNMFAGVLTDAQRDVVVERIKAYLTEKLA